MSRSASWVRLARVVGLAAIASLPIGCGGCGRKPVAKASVRVKQQAEVRIAHTPRPPPPPPRNADGSYTVAGLRYLEWVTGGANPNDALPMIVAIHGHGGDPHQWEERFARVRFKARFIAPFGIHPGEKGGYEWFVGGASHHENLPELEQVLPPAEATVSASLVAINKARPTRGKMILTGFSQGAVMSYTLAFRHGDSFSVACPMSGLIPKHLLHDTTLPQVKPEYHAFHGDADHTIQLSDAQRTVATLQKLGFKADLKVLHGVGHKIEPALDGIIGCLDNAVRAAATSQPTPTRTRR